MAFISTLGGFLYQVVQESWFISAIVLKYVLIGNTVFLLHKNNLSRENFGNNLQEIGKPLMLSIGVLGLASALLNIQLRPMFTFFSHIVAVLTLGYLFWKY